MEEIKILSVDTEGITEPRNDGTPGSALYAIPFTLNRIPSSVWCDAFIALWKSPPSFTSMHRPSIARVEGAKIILDGTTIEEVKNTHKETLELCVAEANKQMVAIDKEHQQERLREEDQARRRTAIRKDAQNQAKNIKFD